MGDSKRRPVFVLLVLVPLLPWLAVVMQHTDGPLAMLVMPVLLFMLGMMGLGAWVVWQADPWLGALTGWWVVSLLWTRTPQAFELSQVCVLGSLAIILIQRASVSVQRLGLQLTIIGVASQCLLGLVQATHVDPIWVIDVGVVGLLGNPAYLACLLAPFVPLVSWPLAGLFLVTMFLAHGKLAMLAVGFGLAMRYRAWWRELALVGMLATVGLVYLTDVSNLLANAYLRVTIWQLGLSNMSGLDWLIGKGIGQWINTIPFLQDQTNTFAHYYFTYAHSEWVQLFYENGAVALVLVCGWLWAHRAMFSGPYAGSVVTILVLSTGWFVFHLANVALPFLVILGVATSREGNDDGQG